MSLRTATASILLAGLASREVAAQAPPQLSYQGYLTDAGGVPVERTVQFSLRLYDATEAKEPIWSEVQEDVPVSGGLFEVRLGSVAPLALEDDALAAALSTGDLYLGVQVDDDVEMEPRQRLLAVPWAWRASNATNATTVGGQGPSSFASSSHTHEGWDVVSAVAECNEASALSCEECIGTVEIADGSITLADVAGNGCAVDQTFLWNGTAWECGSAPLSAGLLDGTAFDARFVNIAGDTLAGGLAIAPTDGTPAFVTLTGTGVGGEAALVLEGAGGPWVVSADDTSNLFGIVGSGAPYFTIDGAGNVGIPTTSRGGKLEVHADSYNLVRAIVDAGPNAGAEATFGANNGFGSLGLGNVSGDGAQLFNTTGGWQWSTQLNVMGGVGVGTATPAKQLHVVGNALLETSGANNDIQQAFRRSDGAGDPDMYLTYWGQLDRNTLGLTAGSGAGLHVNTDGEVIVGTFAAENFSGTGQFVVMDGNVGIGTTTPTVGLQLQYRNLGINVDGAWVTPATYVGTTQFQARADGTLVLPPGTFSTARDRWKVLLIGSWADDFHGAGAAPHAGWMEFTDQFPTRNIHGRTITIARNADNEFVATSTSGNSFSGQIIIAPNFGSGIDQASIDVRGSIVAGEDTIRLDPLGTSYFRDGNVGIGTTNPDGQLHVTSAGITQVSLESTEPSGGRKWQLQSRDGGQFVIGDSTAAAARVSIDDAGNVGIGTGISAASNTGARLVVNGTVEASAQGDAPTAYVAVIPSAGAGAAARIQTDGASPATDIVLAPNAAEALRVTTSSGTQIQGNLFVNAAGSMAGSITAAGHIYAHSTLHIGDLAEEFPLTPGEKAEAGDVLVIDPEHPGKLRRSGEAYDSKVVGIVSEQPTFRIGVKGGGVPVALVGRAQVKVVGPVRSGDFLVAADVPGHAMRAADPARGGVLGTAMTGFAGERGTVIAFVHLQPAPSGGAAAGEMRALRERVERLEAERRVQVSAASFELPPSLALVFASLGIAAMVAARRRKA